MANEQVVTQVAPAPPTAPVPQVPPAVQAAPVAPAPVAPAPVAPAPLKDSDLRLVVRSLDQWFITNSKGTTISKRTYRPEHKDMSPAELIAAIMPGSKITQLTVRDDGVISFFVV